MQHSFLKRALIFQSLFFCLFSYSQTVAIESPRPGEALGDLTVFIVKTTGPSPLEVQLQINGHVNSTRKTAPFQFEVRLNSELENRITVVALFPDGKRIETEEIYRPIEVDLTEEVTTFQIFPSPKKSWNGELLNISSGRETLKPEVVESAQTTPLDLILLLDISGSMHFFLEELGLPLKQMIRNRLDQGDSVRVIVFDQIPASVELASFLELEDFRTLYNEVSTSVIWDALAVSAYQKKLSARQVIYLISDGADDGSKQTPKSVARLLKEREAILIWHNPSRLPRRALKRLSQQSGGLTIQKIPQDATNEFERFLNHQLRVVIPQGKFPLKIKWQGGKIYYPQWER